MLDDGTQIDERMWPPMWSGGGGLVVWVKGQGGGRGKGTGVSDVDDREGGGCCGGGEEVGERFPAHARETGQGYHRHGCGRLMMLVWEMGLLEGRGMRFLSRIEDRRVENVDLPLVWQYCLCEELCQYKYPILVVSWKERCESCDWFSSH